MAQNHWNNVATLPSANVGISNPLLDNAGNYTAVQVRFVANDAWNSDGPTDTPNDRLMKGLIKEGNGVVDTSMSLSFTNLGSGTYDLYVYGNVNMGPVDLDVSVGTRTNYWTEPASFDDAAGFTESASSDPNTRADGNYVKFTGVTPVNGAIILIATYRGGSDGLGIAGLQLVTTASFPPNTQAVGIENQPQPALAAPGKTATFTVVATGPVATYQWYKNASLISGATTSSFTTPPVTLNDNGAKYKVTVANNISSVTSDEATLTVMNDPGSRVAMIGVSFLGNTGDRIVDSWRMAPADLAGVVPQTNWNNLQWDDWGNVGAPAGGFVGISDLLVDSTGAPTTARLRANCNDAWNADGPTDTPNDRLMKGLLKEGTVGSTMSLSVSNLAAVPAFLDVYVYGNVNGGPADLDVSIAGTTNFWTEPAAFDDASGFTEAVGVDPYTRGTGNYVKFAGLGLTSGGVVTILATYQGGSDGLGIAGVQILSSAAFPTNTMAPEVTQQPVNTYAVAGGTASFTVGLNGPWSVQWRKNGTPIPGATGLTYTTPMLTLADSGSTYDAAVTNNIGSTNSQAATLTVDAATPAVLTQGFLTAQRYTNIASALLSALYSDPSYPGSPGTVYWVNAADVPQTAPNLDDFGAIAWGWVSPTVTSDYTFFLRSDDHGAFYINTTAAAAGVTNQVPIPGSLAPGSETPVCEEGDCCQDFLEPDPNQGGAWHAGELAGLGQTTLTPIHLEAGKLYGICIAFKEQGGDDYAQVAWRAKGDGTPAAELHPISMAQLWTMASHAGNRVSITQQPQSATALVDSTVTLSVNASTLPTPDQWTVQWMKNGVAIPGANGTTYTTPVLTLADSGTQYSARIIALAGTTNSATATITVVSSLGTKLTITSTTTNVTVGWNSTTGTLESTPALSGAATVWTTVGTQNPVTLPILQGENRFYRVRQ